MRRRTRSSRTELVDRKHRLEGEINVLRAEIRRLARRGVDTTDVERRLSRAQQRHHQTRLEIDRTGPESRSDPPGPGSAAPGNHAIDPDGAD